MAASLTAVETKEPSPARIEEIIKTFAQHESDFAVARENYTYRQTARINELDRSGNITGRWETVSDIVFNTQNRRTERVVRAPVSTLRAITLTPEDFQDLKNVQPFVLTTENLPDYQINYLGKEKTGFARLLRLRREAQEAGKGPALFLGHRVGGRSGLAGGPDLRPRRRHRERTGLPEV